MSSSQPRPYVLTIGGFDPCGGAGVLADIKTMEAHGVFGLAAITANTIQTEDTFTAVKAESPDFTTSQIDTLFSRYPIAACKIGLTVSFDQLSSIVTTLAARKANLPIVWDPILRATAGSENLLDSTLFTPGSLLPRLSLVTPNLPEFSTLFPNAAPQQIANRYRCALLIKGGHAVSNAPYVEDHLYTPDGSPTVFSVPRSSGSKHGTGCVLSSAIVAQLALGAPLPEAIRLAQQYVARFIASHPSRLGTHCPPLSHERSI